MSSATEHKLDAVELEIIKASLDGIVQEMQKIYYEDCVYLVAVYLKKLQAYNNSGWTGWTNVDGGIIFNFTRDNYLKVKAGK